MSLVTITKSLGCREADIAQQVAEALNVKLYDDFELKESALYMGIRSEDLKSLDEKAPGWFDRILSRTPDVYKDLMEAVVYEVARTGQGIIIGHGSQVLLRDFGCALHVLIHAPTNQRIINLAQERGIRESDAEKLIRKNDNLQRGFFRYAFNQDLFDPSLYDLIINTRKMGSESTVRLITEAAGSHEIKSCSLEAVDTMKRRSREKQIEAVLIDDGINVSLLNIRVPDFNTVTVQGFAYTENEVIRIRRILEEQPGLEKIDTDISIMPSAGE